MLELQSDSNTLWIKDFVARHEHPPRILHIGNIANNAFNNAKLLMKEGFHCDVLCHDYYHIMGCPEWEDADFEGDVGDDFRPRWHQLETRGYKRPKWFVQGPRHDCLHYLLERNAGNRQVASKLWRRLSVMNGTVKGDFWIKIENATYAIRTQWKRYLIATLSSEPLTRYFDKFYDLLSGKYYRLVTKMAELNRQKPHEVHRYFYLQRALVLFAVHILKVLKKLLPVTLQRALVLFAVHILKVLKKLLPVTFKILAKIHSLISNAVLSVMRKSKLIDIVDQNDGFLASHEKFIEQFKESFPSRIDKLNAEDMLPYGGDLSLWRSVFDHYDVIIGYSTDPILPMLAGKKYFALEHGTLREIPFASDTTGRLCALAYKNAEHAFVTNFDCIENAVSLCGDDFTFINHPFDEDHGLAIDGVARLRDNLKRELQSDFLVFFPTRQDWVEGTGYADKANDELLRAFIELRSEGFRIGLVCCAWGKNIEQSKTIINNGNCREFVKWSAPMGVMQFERTASACDVTADQFKLGAFGGVTFKAMAVGSPILSYLNPELLEGLYSEPPPVINCRYEQEIKAQLLRCLTDEKFLLEAKDASRAWIKNNHAGSETVAAQTSQFRKLLELECR
jgi:hypothetical protein